MAEVKTADKKPQVYTDPETGKRKVRMVPVDKEIIKTDERKLTPAELKKREKVAKAIERENPNMPMDKKMAIATATAKKESVEEYRDPFKAAARSAKYKELSHEYEREKQVRRQKAQKSASQNRSFNSMRKRMEDAKKFAMADKAKYKDHNAKEAPKMKEQVETNEAIDFFKASKALSDYAKKHGGMDKRDFDQAGALVKELGKNSNMRAQDKAFMNLKRHVSRQDTDVRDKMMDILGKHGMVKNGNLMRESVKELSTALLRRYVDKAGKQADTMGTKDQHPKASKRASGEYKAARKIMAKEAKQPTGLIIHMKHKKTGKMVKSVHPGTHSAVRDAKAHIAAMQKKGYEVHKKDLQY